MEYFKQNIETTLPPEPLPLVAENSFIGKEPDAAPLPTFEEAKAKLPTPEWEGHEDYLDCYWRTWQMAFGNICKAMPGTGFVSDFIDTAFNGNLFMWDSSFIVMFGKYADRIFHFQGTLDNFYSHQHRDGFICREIQESTGKDRFTRFDPSATGPDVLAWCEWEYYKSFGDMERLAKVFPPLMAYHRWMAEFHTWPDGTYFSSGWGCGMDNLPRHMPGYDAGFSHGHMIWVDACMQEYNNCNILIEMARLLGREEFIAELEEERQRMYKAINEKLWDEKTGFYYDLWKNGEHSMVQHIGAFWSLISQCAPKDRAERLIDALNDETRFKTETRVPALARNHSLYDREGGYWRGGVWAPTNYMVLKGLDKYEKYELAYEIASDYLYTVVEEYKKHGTVFENYAPEYVDGKPARGNMAHSDFVGWTGLVPITILFEYVFGIKPDAGKHKILWDVHQIEKHGVKQYPFGTEGMLTLICEARADVNEKPVITLESNVPVELEVVWGENGKKQTFTMKCEG